MAFPGERPGANDPEGSPLAAANGAAEAASPRYASNTEILAWLDILLKGKPEEQAKARTEIALILEARGFEEDAEEAYWANVQARATDRRAYDRLIDLYQRRRDRLSETLVQRQIEDVFPDARPVAPDNGTATDAADADTSGAAGGRVRRRVRRVGGQPAAPESAADLTLNAPNWPTLPPAGPDATPVVEPASTVSPGATPAPTTPAGLTASPTVRPQPAAPAAQLVQPVQPVRAAPQPGVQPGVQPVRAADILAGRDAPPAAPTPGGAGRRRRTPLLPNPEPAPARLRFTTGGLIALEPVTIGAFLLASIGAAALIAFLLLAAERSRTPPAPSPASGLPARCTDAALRFPGADNPRAAVVAAYRQQGVDVENPRPGSPRLTDQQAEQVVGGWMAISLLLEHGGQTPPSLVTWLDAETTQPALANVLLAGRTLGSMITPEEWAEMKSWPANSCEGAFLQEPRNAPHVQRMERVVGR